MALAAWGGCELEAGGWLMAKARIKWNVKEFENIRRSSKMVAVIDSSASRIADACGDGFEWSGQQGKSRYRANVSAYTYEARRDNSSNNTLLRNIDAGRR